MKCWDCARLGRCQHASKRVKSCSAYRDYNYNEKGVPYEDVAKILGICTKTLSRRLRQDEKAVLAELKKRGRTFIIDRTAFGLKRFKEVFK